MSMSRRDFEGIAREIGQSSATKSVSVKRRIAHDVAEYLRTTNPAFDTPRFIKAVVDHAETYANGFAQAA